MSSLLDAYQLLHEGALALSECERAGIGIDVPYCDEKIAWLDNQAMRFGKKHEPRLGLAPRSTPEPLRLLVVGMHLNRQSVICVEEFDQEREMVRGRLQSQERRWVRFEKAT